MTAIAKKMKAKNPVTLLIGGAQIVLLLLVGWFLTRAVLLLLNPASAWSPLPQVSSISQAKGAEVSANYDFTSDPFRLSKSEAVERPVFQDPGFDVPETQLALEMKGRTVGNPGSAVIETPDNKERSYQVGDDVLEGVTLQSVTADFIVLDVRGKLERLTFSQENRTGLGLPTDDNNEVASDRLTIQSTGVQPRAVPVVNGMKTADLLNSVRLNPKFQSGNLVGYVLQPRGEGGVLKQFGLKAGDMVTAVNGESLLQGPPDLQGLQRTLSRARQVRLDIIRDGRPQTVKIGQ